MGSPRVGPEGPRAEYRGRGGPFPVHLRAGGKFMAHLMTSFEVALPTDLPLAKLDLEPCSTGCSRALGACSADVETRELLSEERRFSDGLPYAARAGLRPKSLQKKISKAPVLLL